MGARFGRGRLVTALAVAAVSLVVTPASGASCSGRQKLPDLWTKIVMPSFPVGGTTLSTYDAADTALGHLVASNGLAVAATKDDGCDWTVATLPADSPLPDLAIGEAKVVGRTITQVRYGAGSRNAVWALGATEVANNGLVATQPRVLYSADGGTSFAARVMGLPEFGRPIAIRGMGQTNAVLLFHSTTPTSSYSFFSTNDSGRTWSEQPFPGTIPVLADFTVFGATLWGWGSGGVYQIDSRGARRIPDVTGTVKAVDVSRTFYGGLRISVFLASGAERFVSLDGGVTWGTEPAPESVDSVSSHPGVPGLLALSSIETNVLVESPPPFSRNDDFSPQADNVSDVQWVAERHAKGYPLYAFSALALYQRIVPPDFGPPPPPPPPPVDVEVKRPKIVPPPPASIKPTKGVVALKQGQKKVVDYTVSLPPVPTPLDVMFMTDSTGSMARTIASVQEGVQGIVDGLAARGTDLHFGVADFRDYPQTPEQTSNYAYKLHRETGPIDTELEEALQGLTTGGGTTDGDDAALEAMYQAATGAGRKDPLGVRGDLIPPGLGADFRPNAMKVILVATDDEMREPDPAGATYPGPPLATVRQTLVDLGIYLVGIEVRTSSATARPELENLATATGAIAPENGVDCDADGSPDLMAGEALVCEFDPRAGSGIADAFVAMLNGIKDLAPIDLTLKGPAKYVTPKGPLHFTDVNVKAPNTFTLPVEYRCTKANAGMEETVRIGAVRDGKEVVSTTATLRCADIPAPPVEVPPLVPPLVVAAIIPPPPPAPVQNPPPNTNPNLNPNPNPQLNPNAGFAAQEEEQLQLALAENDFGVDFDDELAMSALDRTGPPVPAVAWMAAFAMTSAAAFGMRLARRSTPAPAFNPREFR